MVMNPARVLLYLNLVAATACFGLIAYWSLIGYFNTALAWIVQVAALGGLLSLVFFIGSWLERLDPRS